MRYMLQSVQMDGVVVIGEGEKDEAPMLYNGEQIGDGSPPQVDIAVDPLEGTTLAANGMPSALAVIALSSRGTMFDPGPCVYMEKMAGSPEIADLLDLDRPLSETVRLVAERKGRTVGDVMVVVLDRPRHEEGIGDPSGRRARTADRPRRRLGGALGGDGALPGGPAVGNRRHARGGHFGGGGQVPRGSAAGAAVAA
jgi:fructose-1,6-bisphosphatase/sedoheptulose 1,7-bisphosphatase-like protein